jgi:hypothetical protein
MLVLSIGFTFVGAEDRLAAQPCVSHVVIIWLKRPGDAQDPKDLMATRQILAPLARRYTVFNSSLD